MNRLFTYLSLSLSLSLSPSAGHDYIWQPSSTQLTLVPGLTVVCLGNVTLINDKISENDSPELFQLSLQAPPTTQRGQSVHISPDTVQVAIYDDDGKTFYNEMYIKLLSVCFELKWQFLHLAVLGVHFVLYTALFAHGSLGRTFCALYGTFCTHGSLGHTFCALYGTFCTHGSLGRTFCTLYGTFCTWQSWAYILCSFCTWQSWAYILCSFCTWQSWAYILCSIRHFLHMVVLGVHFVLFLHMAVLGVHFVLYTALFAHMAVCAQKGVHHT